MENEKTEGMENADLAAYFVDRIITTEVNKRLCVMGVGAIIGTCIGLGLVYADKLLAKHKEKINKKLTEEMISDIERGINK